MATYILVIVLVPMLLFLGGAYLTRILLERDRRRSPLNSQLWNQPGEGLRRRLATIDERISDVALYVVLAAPGLLIVYLIPRVNPTQMQLRWSDGYALVVCAAVLAYALTRLHKHALHRRNVRDGLAAELTVAQYLIPLMAEGCMVFHDVPAEQFNLDHVVVGPQAVFMIETKSRKKPEARGADAAKVAFDGKGLKFPEHIETAPLEQARSQARWLSNYLAGAAGEPVKVVPVLALPGWWVDLSPAARSSDLVVSNLKNPKFLLNPAYGAVMSNSLRTRVAHAITSRYRG